MKSTLKCSTNFSYTVLFGALMILSGITQAKPPSGVKLNVERVENTKENETLYLPYVFSTEDLGTVFGFGAMVTGKLQPQLTVGGTVFGGGETKGAALGLWDYSLFDTNRLFISAIGMVGKYPLLRAYAPLPSEHTPIGEARAGSNDSNYDDFIQSSGTNNWWDVKLEYVLPIGNAVNKGMATYNIKGGLLVDDKEIKDWNPLATGTTVLVARQFNRYQLITMTKVT